MNYWASGYWHANYWHADFWGEYVDPASGDWWHENYFHNNYWATGYWAEVVGDTTTISQVATPGMTMTAQVPAIDISLEVVTTTPSMTLSGQAAAVANNVTVEASSPTTMTLTALNATADEGEYYVADINYSVYMASLFTVTETVSATAPSMALTVNAADIEEGSNIVVGVTSTPTMTLTSYPAIARNPVVVQPGTPSMSLTSYSVDTGFGTLVEATLPSMSLSGVQANVVGVNADVNEMDATLASMMLTELNPEVIGQSVRTTRRGWIKTLNSSRRYMVEVDGKFFEVESIAEAQKLLEQLREVAEVAAQKDVTTSVAPKPPKIRVTTASGKATQSKVIQSEVKKTQKVINTAYTRAAETFKQNDPTESDLLDLEIAELMHAKLRREMEDEYAIMALLM